MKLSKGLKRSLKSCIETSTRGKKMEASRIRQKTNPERVPIRRAVRSICLRCCMPGSRYLQAATGSSRGTHPSSTRDEPREVRCPPS